MPADLLFELGCEEIPAKMLAKAIADLPGLVRDKLVALNLGHHEIRALGTPRRLAFIVTRLDDRQQDVSAEVVGPPVSAAFAPDGTLTKAGQGFAAKNNVAPEAVTQKEVAGKKGLYAVAIRETKGQDTRTLLPDLLRSLAAELKWPKSMRWGWSDATFVRPVQWLVALFGGEVVPFEWAGQTAGRVSRGHRFLSNGPVEIASADKYVDALRQAHVIVDPQARRVAIESTLPAGVREDKGLLDEVVNLVEYPVVVQASFDPSFLEVPEEIIVTAMRTHQRYFAMQDASGKLAPRFVTIAGTIVKDPEVVAKGNQTVIASRLSDAKFFFAEDKKKAGFDEWNAKLDGTVFQAKLGDKAKTIGQKVRRIEAIVDHLNCGEDTRRAAALCKADLASHVVGEFPELQGTMGRHYAVIFGEKPEVATAIEQHWWPKGQGAALPSSVEAIWVAIADRMDTLVGCFATGLVPSGNADPLGLRRAAIGILQIQLARSEGGIVSAWLNAAVIAYGDSVKLTDEAKSQLREFFKQRLRGILADDEKIDVQAVDVALGAGADDPFDARERARAMVVLPHDTRAVFKRIGNILDDAKAKGYGNSDKPQAALFIADVERNLWSGHAKQAENIADAVKHRRYGEAFAALATLREPLAAFFDKGGVMVMDPDAALRENRLALLRSIYEPFAAIGDFRKLGGAS